MSIEYVDCKLEAAGARKLFQSRLQRFKYGEFRFDTKFFIPYYLFRVDLRNGTTLKSQLLAIDAMAGDLDLYGFAQCPTELSTIETTQFGATVLSEKQAFSLLQEKVRRMVYLQGFFKISDPVITGELIQLLYLPYWVGFFTCKDKLALAVIDAIRGSFEGGKVRDLVQQWLAKGTAAQP